MGDGAGWDATAWSVYLCRWDATAGRVTEVAGELGCAWHTVNDAVVSYGGALVEDVDRIGTVTALVSMRRCSAGWARIRIQRGRPRLSMLLTASCSTWSKAARRRWAVPMAGRPRHAVAGHHRVGPTLDLSGPYRAVFDTMLPDAVQIADPFHLVRLANQRLDECRRRVQNQVLGHRGRKVSPFSAAVDPLYRARRLLTRADERLDDRGRSRLLGLLDAGDPQGDVRMAWHAKEVVRSIYDHHDPYVALEFVTRLGHDLQDRSCPIEVNTLGRT